MADNIAITQGTGTIIAADDVSGVYYQRMKLHTGEDGSAEPIGDTDLGASRALWVDNRSSVVRKTVATSTGITIASTNYSAGDQVGPVLSITNAVRASGGTGLITSAVLVDQGDVCPTTAGYDIYLWRATVTVATDNTAGPTVSDADLLNCVGKIEMPAFRDEGSNRMSTLNSIAISFDCAVTTLFVSYVTRGDHNFFNAATDLNLTLFIQQD